MPNTSQTGATSSGAKKPPVRTEDEGITMLPLETLDVDFEPLFVDGKAKEPNEYADRLGNAYPILTQKKGYKKKCAYAKARAHPGTVVRYQTGSGYYRSNIAHAANYTGPMNVEALAEYLLKSGSNLNADTAPVAAELYMTGKCTIPAIQPIICNVDNADANQEQEAEAEEEEADDEGEEEAADGEEEEAEAESEAEDEAEPEDEAESEAEAEGAGLARTLAITAEPNGVCCDQCGARGLWGTDPCPHCGHPGPDEESEDTDELAVTLPPAKRQKPPNLTEEVSSEWDELEAKLDAIERAAAAAATEARKAASKQALYKLRGEITPRAWEVRASTGTNQEEQTATTPLLDRLIEMGVWETHDVMKELALQDLNGKTVLKIDIVLIAYDPNTHCEIRIECKAKNYKEARGQCLYYQELGLLPGVETMVYSYFPKKPEPHVLNGFKRDNTGVLWPGREHTIQFQRSIE